MRCQVVNCNQTAVNGGSYCRRHSREQIVAYRITDPALKDSVSHHNGAVLTDLSQQVVLLRSLIERRLNMASSECEQIAAYNFVANQLATLTKMTETLVKLQREAGDLLDRAEVDVFVDKVISAVSEELKDVPNFEDIVDRIVSRIQEQE